MKTAGNTVSEIVPNCHLIVQQTHFLIELGTGLFGRCTVLASNDQNLWMSLGVGAWKWAHLPEDDVRVQWF